MESSPTQDEGTNPVGGWRTTPQAHDAPCALRKTNPVGGHSICPRCMEFHSNNHRRTSEPPLCKGRCRAERGTGVVPDTNYLLFLFCKLQAFTIPQALARQLPLHKGAFWFVRTSRVTFCRRGRRLQFTVCLAKIKHRRGAFHMPPLVGILS